MRDIILTLAQIVESRTRVNPNQPVVRDLARTMTYQQWNNRSNQLANALMALGLEKGDRVGVLAHNCVEWAEIYLACAKSGLIAVPLNFRLAPQEMKFILLDAGVSAMIAHDALYGHIEEIRADLPLSPARYFHFGSPQAPAGWTAYEAAIETASTRQPGTLVTPDDPWALMYTSGTTGDPKGVIRNHRGMAMIALVTAVELSIRNTDNALLVMPMCHANSLNFFCSYIYSNASVSIYSLKSFDPGHVLHVISENQITFTSVVPTQCILFLELPEKEKARHNLTSMKSMMVSSAPARADTKLAIMEMFPNTGLFELYGSSEAGWVTMLHPEEQFSHLGTVGRECVGSAPILLIDEDGNEVPDGQAGELFSLTPYNFSGYWNQPEKTRQAFRDNHCSVGDIALRDEHGFIRLVDRKENMIISGGENIYPTEVEAILSAYPAIQDAAVVGMPDKKWGESVHAAIVLRKGHTVDQQQLIQWCRERLAAYKCPRSISFVQEDDLPRTATGKIRHRALRTWLSERNQDANQVSQ